MKNKKHSIFRMTVCALMAALICIFAPMSVPIGPVPVSLTNLVLYFCIFIIGTGGTVVSYIVYLLLGIVGLPVFSGYAGGIGKVAGPTGGYLVGFIPMIVGMGLSFYFLRKKKLWVNVLGTMGGMIIGTLIAYALGTLWFVIQMKCTVSHALTVCVFPFIPFDLLKMVVANILGRMVRKPLLKAGLISDQSDTVITEGKK